MDIDRTGVQVISSQLSLIITNNQRYIIMYKNRYYERLAGDETDYHPIIADLPIEIMSEIVNHVQCRRRLYIIGDTVFTLIIGLICGLSISTLFGLFFALKIEIRYSDSMQAIHDTTLLIAAEMAKQPAILPCVVWNGLNSFKILLGYPHKPTKDLKNLRLICVGCNINIMWIRDNIPCNWGRSQHLGNMQWNQMFIVNYTYSRHHQKPNINFWEYVILMSSQACNEYTSKCHQVMTDIHHRSNFITSLHQASLNSKPEMIMGAVIRQSSAEKELRNLNNLLIMGQKINRYARTRAKAISSHISSHS